MPRPHHTIIFVPHARAKLRKWRVTNLHIGFVVGLILLLTLGALGITWLHLQDDVNPAEIARLRGENEKLRGVNSAFETSIQRLQQRLTDSEERTRQLALVAGVESLGDEAGLGGGTPLDDSDATALGALESRAADLSGDLEAIAVKLDERLHWISSTPAIAPVKGILTSGFGHRSDPVTHGRGLHQGIDIQASPRQLVRASADGVVTLAGVQGGYGNAVYLSHGFGVGTRYAHLARVEVRPGQRVKRGDVIGLVGNTGRSTGYHLHYEVRIDGQAVNPIAYILDESSAPL
ncbi:MAG TPA: M23 family metallopeptidase [Thermoanaerobaculia bacterium]|nr:M23 family metallopeptidase [Thermoanaerobaculia bacterium]